MKPVLLSIVIPVYNSASSLDELVQRINNTLSGKQDYELILVDDGSKDESWIKIESLKKKFPEQIRGIRLSKNFGQHNAIVCGFTFLKGDAVLTMDDDLQHPPEEIVKLIDKFDQSGADVVYGIYTTKQHNVVRNAGSTIAKRSSKSWSGNVGFSSSFRLMKKELTDKIVLHKNQAHVFIDEILYWYTSRFETVEVEHHPRKSGESGYTFRRLAFMYFDTLINYTAIPLKMMTWIGLLSSIITFLLGGRFIYIKLVHRVPPGFTALIVAILFSTSLLMFCMGIMGQYLYKIYHLQSRRPAYSIHTIL
jgi:glycosyltransferase involved in cell wall biosynthesis